MKKDVIYVSPDKSTVEQKLSKTIELGYCLRRRWVDNQRIFVLAENYGKYFSMAKNLFFECTEIQNNHNKIFHTEFYRFKRNNALLATIYVVPKEVPSTDLLYDAVFNQNLHECFTSSSLLLNIHTRSGRRNGNKSEFLDYVQLYRYDPFGEHAHVNNFSVVKSNCLKVYQRYFPREAGFPHFHFVSAVEAEKLGGTAKANAIDLNGLIRYVEDLSKDHDEKSVLNTNDFGMPFLAVKKLPQLYKSTIDAEKVLLSRNINQLLKCINNSFVNSGEHQSGKTTEGLKGVLLDLKVLAKLHSCADYSKKTMLVEMKLVNKICGGIPEKSIKLEEPVYEK